FSSRRRHTRLQGDWSSDVCSSDLPGVARAAVLRDATQGSGTSQFAAVQAVAPSLRVEVNPVNTRDAGEIERAIAAFARAPNGGQIGRASCRESEMRYVGDRWA